MKKLIKSLVIGVALCSAVCANAAVLATNLAASGGYSLLSTRGSINSIQASSTSPMYLEFFDNNSISAANSYGTNVQITSAYVTRSGYATNLVTSFVGNNGYTNWYTNAGYFTYNVTNAVGTNKAPVLFAIAAPANAPVNIPVDALFAKGLVVHGNPATNVFIVITYDP